VLAAIKIDDCRCENCGGIQQLKGRKEWSINEVGKALSEEALTTADAKISRAYCLKVMISKLARKHPYQVRYQLEQVNLLYPRLCLRRHLRQ